VDKVIESSTVGKGKQKVAPARAKVYAVVDGLVSVLLKLLSTCASTFAYSVTDVSRGRRSQSASQTRTSDTVRSVRPTRVDVCGGGRSRGRRG
jgi:hypothetical protein